MPEAKPPHPSFWIESTPETSYPTLAAGISVDVAVIGAGITGLTAAALLKRAGKTVAVVEAKQIVRGASGYTTAKVTAGHGVIYSELTKTFGAEGARMYAEANQAALDRVARFVEEAGIECDFERKANYVYAETEAEASGARARGRRREALRPRGVVRGRRAAAVRRRRRDPTRVAAPIEAARSPEGMFINSGTPTRSVRTIRDGERVLVQVGGNGHKAGWERNTPERYRQLEEFLGRHWSDAGPVEFRWSTQDYMSFDRLPYVGNLRRGSAHVTTATGFNKWGMTNGTAAAMILSDRILGRENEWARLFDANRLKPRASAGQFVKEGASVGVRFVADRLRRAERSSPEELQNGEGAIVRVGGWKRAVYRDESGTLHVLSPVCQHLACVVSWNSAERTWDCPCHGSRYTGEGHVIQGPTAKDLERIG
jgi:glycine/D-amino acid oxidase-like deaminating enzyme/nitrite reductase/ring-hydroxylating ferredoxin subunit